MEQTIDNNSLVVGTSCSTFSKYRLFFGNVDLNFMHHPSIVNTERSY